MGRPRLNNNTEGFIGDDERLKRGVDDSRVDRESADHVRTAEDGTAFTADERRKFYRNEWKQEVLPNPPAIPGYHLCWLSSSSKMDPVQNRMRLGYVPVKANEINGFDKTSMSTMKGGEWDGFVSCNEMLLFKLPMDIYQEMMTEFHHNMPLEQEQNIRQQIEHDNSQRDSSGKNLGSIVGDGFNDMGRNRQPVFS